jgi:hypothetical protein
MSAREGFESIHKLAASATVGVLADFRCNEHPVGVDNVADGGIDERLSNAIKIGLAARQQIWSRFSKDELHALGDHKGCCERKRESHPTNVPLPKLPPPDERLGGSSASSWAGYEDHAHDEDECDNNEEPCWDCFVVLKGVRDVEIDWGEGAVVRVDIFPTSADCCNCAVVCC